MIEYVAFCVKIEVQNHKGRTLIATVLCEKKIQEHCIFVVFIFLWTLKKCIETCFVLNIVTSIIVWIFHIFLHITYLSLIFS